MEREKLKSNAISKFGVYRIYVRTIRRYSTMLSRILYTDLRPCYTCANVIYFIVIRTKKKPLLFLRMPLHTNNMICFMRYRWIFIFRESPLNGCIYKRKHTYVFWCKTVIFDLCKYGRVKKEYVFLFYFFSVLATARVKERKCCFGCCLVDRVIIPTHVSTSNVYRESHTDIERWKETHDD